MQTTHRALTSVRHLLLRPPVSFRAHAPPRLRHVTAMATAAPPRIAAHGSSPEITRKLSEAFADAEVQQLREELGFGVPATAAGSTFAPEAFFGALDSRRAGHALLVAGDIASTQEFMRQHSSRLPDGALFVADRQTSGALPCCLAAYHPDQSLGNTELYSTLLSFPQPVQSLRCGCGRACTIGRCSMLAALLHRCPDRCAPRNQLHCRPRPQRQHVHVHCQLETHALKTHT